jgi:hypothetical protein
MSNNPENFIINERPPLVTTDELSVDYGYLERAVASIRDEGGTLPAVINDEKTQGHWQDVIKQMDDKIKAINPKREEVKSPYLAAGRTVDGFFQGVIQRVGALRKEITDLTDGYLTRKRDEERRVREEAAAKLRAEQEAAAKLAREAQERADRQAAQHRKAASEASRAKAEEAERESARLREEAAAAEVAAQAKSADLSRTRSDGGSLGSLADTWNFRILEIEDLKGAAIWPFVSRDAKEKAVRAFMKANAPRNLAPGEKWEPKGLEAVEFYRESKGKYR